MTLFDPPTISAHIEYSSIPSHHSSQQYQCKECRKVKPATDFHRHHNQERARTVYPYCKNCRQERDAKRRKAMREFLWEEKARRGGCMDCGRNYHPHLLDFDHRPTNKNDLHYQIVGDGHGRHYVKKLPNVMWSAPYVIEFAHGIGHIRMCRLD